MHGQIRGSTRQQQFQHTAVASFCAESADNNAGRTSTCPCRMEAIAGPWHYHGRGDSNLRWALAAGGDRKPGTCTPQWSNSVSKSVALPPHAVFGGEAGNACVDCSNGGPVKNIRRVRAASRPHMVQTTMRDGAGYRRWTERRRQCRHRHCGGKILTTSGVAHTAAAGAIASCTHASTVGARPNGSKTRQQIAKLTTGSCEHPQQPA